MHIGMGACGSWGIIVLRWLALAEKLVKPDQTSVRAGFTMLRSEEVGRPLQRPVPLTHPRKI
jgi:hypothetical protein